MRKKDWADTEAEFFYQVIADSEGDDEVVRDIAEALRNAYLRGVTHQQMGLTTNTSKGGDVSTYVCTTPRNLSRAEAEKALRRLGELEANGFKLTWNGVPSVKKGKEDGS